MMTRRELMKVAGAAALAGVPLAGCRTRPVSASVDLTDPAWIDPSALFLRPGSERGHVNHGWLDARHSFSFASYRDPRHMGWGPLRVINEDRIAGGRGFGWHPHESMEILTWIIDGALEHRDSMGNGSVIRPGEIQYMSAGSGVRHSEFNALEAEPTHLLQIWIQPSFWGGEPRYDQRQTSMAQRREGWTLLASGAQDTDAIHIRQDAQLLTAAPGADGELSWTVPEGRRTWVQVIRGEVAVQGLPLVGGDAVGTHRVAGELLVQGRSADAEVMLFDLPG